MKLQLALKDGTEIDLVEAGYSGHFVVICKDEAEFQTIWQQMTEENLSEVEIREDGEAVQKISSLSLSGTQTVWNPDGTLTGHFYTEGGDIVDDEYSEAGKILLGEGDNE